MYKLLAAAFTCVRARERAKERDGVKGREMLPYKGRISTAGRRKLSKYSCKLALITDTDSYGAL